MAHYYTYTIQEGLKIVQHDVAAAANEVGFVLHSTYYSQIARIEKLEFGTCFPPTRNYKLGLQRFILTAAKYLPRKICNWHCPATHDKFFAS